MLLYRKDFVNMQIHVIVALIIAVIILLGLWKLYSIYKKKINFFIEGMDQGFSFSELSMLWKVADSCEMENPVSIFVSMPSLTRAISSIKSQAESSGSANSARNQNLLSKLYTFRNKIEKEADKKRGLESTKSLSNGQKLRIILPGKGVFTSELVNNGRELTIRVPTQKGTITVEGQEWIGKSISVYLWRKGDARYVFDTKVNNNGVFLGKPALFLAHSTNLVRSQKRNAIRAKCHILCNMYILQGQVIDYNSIETKPGYKCLLEDISEKGALIRIGGKGMPNVQIRLQYQIDGHLIVMFGVVRTVEYNAEINQSRLHFECIHIDKAMKNQVLSYVYNILPEKEKEIYDAIALSDEDDIETEDKQNKTSEQTSESDGIEQLTPEKGPSTLEKAILDTDEVINQKQETQEKASQTVTSGENDDLPLLEDI